jgi:hypothetical protein
MSVRDQWRAIVRGLVALTLFVPFAVACSDGAPMAAPGAPTATVMPPVTGTGMGMPPPAAPPRDMPMAMAGSAGMATPPIMMPGGDMMMPPVAPNMTDPGAPPMPSMGINEMQTLVPDPSWDCAMPEGIPPPEMGELVFEVEFTLGEVYEMGETQYGTRVLTEITGGTLSGMIEGEFLPRGLDWQLTLPTGSVEVEQVNMFTAMGGTVYFRNCGVSPMGGEKVRIVPDFEAPMGGALGFLNEGKFAGYREFDKAAKTMTMSVYDVTNVMAPADKVTIVDPPELRNQTWECKERMGTQGGVLYQESVGIAGNITVGQSKRGSRNAIPINGGTTGPRLEGIVLDGGADFQLTGSGGFILDARYTVKTNDDELIIVRNCGPASGLIPVFETRKDGPYAFVNEGNYFSSTPSPTGCCVAITIYEE